MRDESPVHRQGAPRRPSLLPSTVEELLRYDCPCVRKPAELPVAWDA